MPYEKLSSAESAQFAQQVSELARAGQPLAEGLRAAAEDSPSRRLAGVLRRLAGEIDRGAPLDEALARLETFLPNYVQGMIQAGLRSGTLTEVLDQLVQSDRAARQMRHEIRLAIGYPLFLLVTAGVLLLLIFMFILPEFQLIFSAFESEIPPLTAALLMISNVLRQTMQSTFGRGILLLAVTLAILFVVAKLVERLTLLFPTSPAGGLLVRLAQTPTRCVHLLGGLPVRILSTAPLIGPLIVWQATARWSRLLALLVDARVPLPEALDLLSRCMPGAGMSQMTTQLADGVQQGKSLGALIGYSRWLPESLAPLVDWGVSSGQLAGALRTASEMFEGRIQLRASLFKQVAPPVMLLAIASCVCLIIVGIYLPLISLIRNLSM